jgi:hypothetical protein
VVFEELAGLLADWAAPVPRRTSAFSFRSRLHSRVDILVSVVSVVGRAARQMWLAGAAWGRGESNDGRVSVLAVVTETGGRVGLLGIIAVWEQLDDQPLRRDSRARTAEVVECEDLRDSRWAARA